MCLLRYVQCYVEEIKLLPGDLSKWLRALANLRDQVPTVLKN
jgi:hypothetical protein